MAQPPDPNAEDEEKLRMLLALTSQSLPQSRRDGNAGPLNLDDPDPAEEEAVYHYLDTHPEALEQVIRNRRRAPATSPQGRFTAWLAQYDWRQSWRGAGFALAGIVLAIFVGGGLWLQYQPGPSLGGMLDQSYAELSVDPEPLAERLVLPWERPPSALGFSPAALESIPVGRAFAAGWLAGAGDLMEDPRVATARQRLGDYEPTPAFSVYADLGRWNVLLWAALQSTSVNDGPFWQRQQQTLERLRAVLGESETVPVPVPVQTHLTAVEPLLAQLAGNQSPARAARELEREVIRLRELLLPAGIGEENL